MELHGRDGSRHRTSRRAHRGLGQGHAGQLGPRRSRRRRRPHRRRIQLQRLDTRQPARRGHAAATGQRPDHRGQRRRGRPGSIRRAPPARRRRPRSPRRRRHRPADRNRRRPLGHKSVGTAALPVATRPGRPRSRSRLTGTSPGSRPDPSPADERLSRPGTPIAAATCKGPILRVRADAGDVNADQLAGLLAQRGRREDAERLQRFGLNPDGSIAYG